MIINIGSVAFQALINIQRNLRPFQPSVYSVREGNANILREMERREFIH